METLANLEQALGEQGGEHKITTETADLNDADTVTFPGDVVVAWADAQVNDHVANVTGTSGADVTVAVRDMSDATAAGSAQSVTVVAVHE